MEEDGKSEVEGQSEIKDLHEFYLPPTKKVYGGYSKKFNPDFAGMNTQQIGSMKKLMKARRDVEKYDGVIPHVPHPQAFLNVTDLKYYMDGFLRDNLGEVPNFLKKSWDCVIIVSGSGKVRIGKSTIAMQMAYYLAWLMNEDRKKHGLVKKDNPTPFNIDNVVFSPQELVQTAMKLPKNSVIVYDEGRAGLDSARAMENINKATQDFFQECGALGHIIVIVLPDFFKLQETIAIPRSLFLINCYTDKNYNRGYFSFYSEKRKEVLYVYGKKKIVTLSKYLTIDANFHGKFVDFFPVNKEAYDNKKKEALSKRKKSQREVRWHIQRDTMFYVLEKHLGMTYSQIAAEVSKFLDEKVTESVVSCGIEATKRRLKKEYFEE